MNTVSLVNLALKCTVRSSSFKNISERPNRPTGLQERAFQKIYIFRSTRAAEPGSVWPNSVWDPFVATQAFPFFSRFQTKAETGFWIR